MGKIIAIIPARGGSKGILRKNIKQLGDKPLLAHTIEDAKKCDLIDEIVVSTEDKEIKQIALEWGAKVVDRPSDLAMDESPTLPVLIHALKTLEEQGDDVELIVLLQATALFKKPQEIREAIEIMKSGKYDSLISLSPVPKHFSPFWQKEIKDNTVRNFHNKNPIDDDKNSVRRQDLPQTYWKNGQIYIMTRKTLLEKESLFGSRSYGFIIDRNDVVNIDVPADFEQAQRILEENNGVP